MNKYINKDPENCFIVAFAYGDVNGDSIIDKVYLTGQKTADSPYIQNITLVIQDGRTGRYASVPLKNNGGYNPTLFLGDFNGDKIDDILICINSGGSGAITYDYLFSFVQNVPKLLFDSDVYNDTFNYDVIYKDNYKVEVTSKIGNAKYIIDISLKGSDYLNEIYYKTGKLKAPITGFVNPVSALYPVDIDSDGVYELFAFQKIAGRYNADSLGYVQNVLMWNKTSFNLSLQYVAILGQ